MTRPAWAKDVFERLCKLEEQLRPDSLLELARTYALIKTGSAIGLEDVYMMTKLTGIMSIKNRRYRQRSGRQS